MCTSSARAGEHINVIIYSSSKPSTASRGSVSNAASYVESHVMLVGHRRGAWSHDCQGVLAVLQHGSPVNDAKPSTEVRSTIKKILSVA